MAASAVFGEEGADGLFEVVALRGGWLCDRFFGPGDLCGCGFVGRDGGEDAGCEQQRDTGEQEVFRLLHGYRTLRHGGRNVVSDASNAMLQCSTECG